MSDIEVLSVRMVSRFISFTLQHDCQAKVNRTQACTLLRSSVARSGDIDVIHFPSEKYDKILTFLLSNDQQVHYASASNSVGVYAFARLTGDLRRLVRDYTSGTRERGELDDGLLPMMSPRDPPPTGGSGGGGPRRPTDIDLSRFRAAATTTRSEHEDPDTKGKGPFGHSD